MAKTCHALLRKVVCSEAKAPATASPRVSDSMLGDVLLYLIFAIAVAIGARRPGTIPLLICVPMLFLVPRIEV